MRNREFPLGTVIQGTTNNKELLPAFLQAYIDRFPEDDRDENIIEQCYELIDEIDCGNAGDFTEDISELIDVLTDELNFFAPLYVNFGSHPGDGADFGFWPDIEYMEEAALCGKLLKVKDLSDIPDNHNDIVMVVNDHGNVTLYEPRIEYRAVWSVV